MSTGEDLIGELFCDVTLTGIVWKDVGVDLDVELGDSGLVGYAAARFACRWLRSVKIALDLSRNPGPPLTWEGSVERTEDGGFRLSLRFGSGGAVTVECNELELHGRT